MKEDGLCGRQKGRYRVNTTDSNHDQPIAPNRLAEAPDPIKSGQIWVGDITCIRTSEDWLFLAAILNLYSRKIVDLILDLSISSTLGETTLTAISFA